MADISDIENVLVSKIAGSLFSGGYSPGTMATALTGGQVKLYRGWPVSAELEADIAASKSHVSVFPEAAMTRNTTRYQDQWVQPSTVTPTLTVTVSGNVATFAGTPAAGQMVGVLTGRAASTSAAVYAVQAGDTLAGIATALAGQITGASSSGAAFTCTSVPTVRITMTQAATLITRQQEQGFRISIWCPSPAARDLLAGYVDASLALTHSFTLSTGEFVRLIYRATMTDDKPSQARLWVRHLRYTAEYPTTSTQTQQPMLIGVANETLNGGGVVTLIE